MHSEFQVPVADSGLPEGVAEPPGSFQNSRSGEWGCLWFRFLWAFLKGTRKTETHVGASRKPPKLWFQGHVEYHFLLGGLAFFEPGQFTPGFVSPPPATKKKKEKKKE